MQFLPRFSYAALVLTFLSSTAFPQNKPSERDSDKDVALLDDFVKEKAKAGWKLKDSPSTFKSCQAVVVAKGNLDALMLKQEVTLSYSWAVVATVQVDPGKKQLVRFQSKSGETAESEFRIISPYKLDTTLDISKSACQDGAPGFGVKMTVKTGQQETKLVLNLQQVLQVYSTGKTPRLLATGYLQCYGSATLVLKTGSE